MDLSFSTSAGGSAWSLEECAKWASENGFEAVRLDTSGATDPGLVLEAGPAHVIETLDSCRIYLAALTAHNNLLHDDVQEREAAAEGLRLALDSVLKRLLFGRGVLALGAE